jgi:hypothetical protein
MIILAFLAEVAMMIGCLAIVLPKMTFSPDCLVAHAPGLFMAYWYVPLLSNMSHSSPLCSLQDVIASLRNVLVRPDVDQVLPDYFARKDVYPLCLRAGRHMGIRPHFW